MALEMDKEVFFFHLLEFTVIINCIILASHGSKLSPIQTDIGQDLRMSQTQTTRQDRQAPFISQIKTVHNTQQTVASGREQNCVPCMFC
jgi:hypothetical protein